MVRIQASEICAGEQKYQGGNIIDQGKILMVIAPKEFQGQEYSESKKVFIEHGFKVVTASERAGECIEKYGARVWAEVPIHSLSAHDFDAIVLIGGPGATEYFHEVDLLHLIQDAEKAGKILAAICIAPVILANAGVLKGKRVTAFSTVRENLIQAGASFTGDEVEIDGNIVTADGPEASERFAEEIVKLIA